MSVREATSDVAFQTSRARGCRMSYGEQIALRGHADIETVASAAGFELRPASEDQFLEGLRRGEAAAYERLVAEQSGDVYALLFRLTNDAEEARDLTQETFLRAFQSINRFRGDSSLKTWIYRIAINQARNRWRWWRRRRRAVTVSLDATGNHEEQPLAATLASKTSPSPEQEARAREREGRLREARTGRRRWYGAALRGGHGAHVGIRNDVGGHVTPAVAVRGRRPDVRRAVCVLRALGSLARVPGSWRRVTKCTERGGDACEAGGSARFGTRDQY